MANILLDQILLSYTLYGVFLLQRSKSVSADFVYFPDHLRDWEDGHVTITLLRRYSGSEYCPADPAFVVVTSVSIELRHGQVIVWTSSPVMLRLIF
uniref:Uncharacterized protein n=1 Tax=Ciona intestinalis TaxID=7719 RepID=H2XVA5_CIOIN